MYTFETKGVCARKIDFTIDNGVVSGVSFEGGCNGNLQGLSTLVEGMKVEEVISKLKGINCKERGTSCPDQLAKALSEKL